jgi:glycosyltransferase involved in cell wall biosynthesis
MKKRIAFFVYPVLRFPRNCREYYLTKELQSRGWAITWLLPKSGKNEGVPVNDFILRYSDLDIRGRSYLLPAYLSLLLRARRTKYLWISGWSIRSLKEIYWLIRIMGLIGIETIYDPIDPICEFELGSNELNGFEMIAECRKKVNSIYRMCRKVLCVTPEMRALLISKGAEKSNLAVARWASDYNVFNRKKIKGDFRQRLGISKATILIGWMGSMAEFKGLREIIMPLAEKFIYDNSIHFIIAGDGPLYNEIELWAASKKEGSITIMGRMPYSEAAEFTAAIDVYLVPTDPTSEYARAICPIKCYDAIAMNTPLVTTRTPASEYLKEISDKVHLCDYNINSFEKVIQQMLIQQKYSSEEHSSKIQICHQSVSIEIANLLEG